MLRQSFNTGWTCRHLINDAPAVPVTLPHDAMLGEKQSVSAMGGAAVCHLLGYDYVYEKSFTPAPDVTAALLEFEGVWHRAEVWLNDEKLYFHPCGLLGFTVDLTGKLRPGEENRLTVVARNADQPSSRFYIGAGILRPVWLWTANTDAYLIPGSLKVQTVSVDHPEIAIQAMVSRPGRVRVEILDGNSVLADVTKAAERDITLRFALDTFQPWSPASPKLYTCRVRYGDSLLETEFGLRLIQWDAGGLYINGVHTVLNGACVHTDFGMLGGRSLYGAAEQRARWLKAQGFNAVRCVGMPCSPDLLKACDRIGLAVVDECTDAWFWTKAIFDESHFFPEHWKQYLSEMVAKDYNHPSVILYSVGNDAYETGCRRGTHLLQQLVRQLHHLDKSRPVTCGINPYFNLHGAYRLGIYRQWMLRGDIRRINRVRKEGGWLRTHFWVGERPLRWMSGFLGGRWMKWRPLSPLCKRRLGKNDRWLDIPGRLYSLQRMEADLNRVPDRPLIYLSGFSRDTAAFHDAALQYPALAGFFVWTGIDHLGYAEPAAKQRFGTLPKRRGPGRMTAGCGLLDLNGSPSGAALYQRVASGAENGPYLAVCPPVHFLPMIFKPTLWQSSLAMPSWTLPEKKNGLCRVEIYARAHAVCLRLNGTIIRSVQLEGQCRAIFYIRYQPGVLDAITLDKDGNETARCSLVSSGSGLMLLAECERVYEDGLAYVRLRYTDSGGITLPHENGRLKAEVTGGTLEAFGNACPWNPDGYTRPECDTWRGEAMAVVRCGDGETVLEVSDGRMKAHCVLPAVTI